jgi:hypothetical protein
LLSTATENYNDPGVEPGRVYVYTLLVVKVDGSEVASAPLTVRTLPVGFELCQNYPNPFNPATHIAFQLPGEAFVNLSVYDPGGSLVKTLVNGLRGAGMNRVEWEGTDSSGRPAASGVYLYRLKSGGRVLTRKMLLVR